MAAVEMQRESNPVLWGDFGDGPNDAWQPSRGGGKTQSLSAEWKKRTGEEELLAPMMAAMSKERNHGRTTGPGNERSWE